MDYNKLASEESVKKTIAALKERNVEAMVVATGAEALEEIKKLIPKGASIMNGSSRTLEQIGFVKYLESGTHPWNNLHEAILKEKDENKQAMLRKQAVLSDFYLGSVHALAESGEFLIASNSGSQLPHIVFTSPNIIFVVSTKKIVPTLQDAFERLDKHVTPLEDNRMMQNYNAHTYQSKIVMFKRESPWSKRKVRMILVNEDLGF